MMTVIGQTLRLSHSNEASLIFLTVSLESWEELKPPYRCTGAGGGRGEARLATMHCGV